MTAICSSIDTLRSLKRRMEKEKEKLKEEWKKKRKELEEARAARPEPTSPAELVTYFFETEFNEMEFEIVRNRPKLNEEFFAYLKSQMEDDTPDEDMKGKIEALNTVTSNFVGFVDQTTKAMLQPKERMMKLLTAKDKRAMILEMVDNNELDMNLMALLMTNINTRKPPAWTKKPSLCKKFIPRARNSSTARKYHTLVVKEDSLCGTNNRCCSSTVNINAGVPSFARPLYLSLSPSSSSA